MATSDPCRCFPGDSVQSVNQSACGFVVGELCSRDQKIETSMRVEWRDLELDMATKGFG